MDIIFACPRCQYSMQVPDDKAGSRTRCSHCQLPLEVPFPKGQLIEVRPSALGNSAAGAAVAVAAPPRNAPPQVERRTSPSWPGVSSSPTAGRLKADDLLKLAGACKEQGDLDGAIRHLRTAYDEICRANALFPVEDFLRLPMYLQQAGRGREAWQEFNDLLFQGYPNQTRDVTLVAQDRSKIFDKMRLFLEMQGNKDLAKVFSVFSLVCKGISLHHEGRTRELRTWFSKSACADFVKELKRFKGNLGKLQGVQYAVIGELDEYPTIDFDLLAQRIDLTLRS
jgi:hypothetical protein